MPLHVSDEITEAANKHHPSVQQVARYFTKGEHLAEANLREISIWFHNLAMDLLLMQPSLQGPQLTIALNKLMESKDAAVRAAL
jgi:hypothetical protein